MVLLMTHRSLLTHEQLLSRYVVQHATTFKIDYVVGQADNYERYVIVACLGDAALKTEALLNNSFSDRSKRTGLLTQLFDSPHDLILRIAAMDTVRR